jgi:putative ABC transport system permease protein
MTVAFPPLAYYEQSQLRRIRDLDPWFASEHYLTVRLERETPVERRPGSDPLADERGKQFTSAVEELRRQVGAQPGVGGVTLADVLPSTNQDRAWVEVGGDASGSTRLAAVATVHPSYFDVLQAPVLAGRNFTMADAQPGTRVAIVDQGFVDEVLQGRNPIGQQVRFPPPPDSDAPPSLWYEIVGVVKELGAGSPFDKGRAAGFYIPATPAGLDAVYMMVQVRAGDPMTFASQVRTVARTETPSLRLVDFKRANTVNGDMVSIIGLWLRVTMIMTGVALVLSLAGIYAVFSFAVSRRTREIGLRVALGARPSGVARAIFRRPLIQVTVGIVIGTVVMLTLASLLKHTQLAGAEKGLTIAGAAMFLVYSTVMLGVCLTACVVPARRALRVEPTVALRVD